VVVPGRARPGAALETPPQRHRRRSCSLYGGVAEDRPKNRSSEFLGAEVVFVPVLSPWASRLGGSSGPRIALTGACAWAARRSGPARGRGSRRSSSETLRA